MIGSTSSCSISGTGRPGSARVQRGWAPSLLAVEGVGDLERSGDGMLCSVDFEDISKVTLWDWGWVWRKKR